ncbi:dj-1 protein, partial [Syncephalis pseudoplumigaleata]
VEMLRRAGVHVTLASVQTESTTVECNMGINIVADKPAEEADYDAVILPGGLGGSKTMAASELVKQTLKQYHEAGKLVALICAGPTVLAAAGIAKGGKITSYPSVKSEFAGKHMRCSSLPLLLQLHVRGPGTVFPFAMAIIEHLLGKAAADKLRSSCLIKE